MHEPYIKALLHSFLSYSFLPFTFFLFLIPILSNHCSSFLFFSICLSVYPSPSLSFSSSSLTLISLFFISPSICLFIYFYPSFSPLFIPHPPLSLTHWSLPSYFTSFSTPRHPLATSLSTLLFLISNSHSSFLCLTIYLAIYFLLSFFPFHLSHPPVPSYFLPFLFFPTSSITHLPFNPCPFLAPLQSASTVGIDVMTVGASILSGSVTSIRIAPTPAMSGRRTAWVCRGVQG